MGRAGKGRRRGMKERGKRTDRRTVKTDTATDQRINRQTEETDNDHISLGIQTDIRWP